MIADVWDFHDRSAMFAIAIIMPLLALNYRLKPIAFFPLLTSTDHNIFPALLCGTDVA